MMDWGFAFGVAWAVARGQDPAAPEELVSIRALDVTQAVYDAYRGSSAPAQALERYPTGQRRSRTRTARGAPDARDLRTEHQPARLARDHAAPRERRAELRQPPQPQAACGSARRSPGGRHAHEPIRRAGAA